MIRRVPLGRLALILLLAAGVGWMLTHRVLLKMEAIEPALRAQGIWAPIGFILIYATATVLFFRCHSLVSPAAPCLVRSGAPYAI